MTDEIDLDWAAWDKAHPWPGHEPKQGQQGGKKGRSKELANFQKRWGLPATGVLDAKTKRMIALKASQKHHLRAKALLAGTAGNTKRADVIEAVRQIKRTRGNKSAAFRDAAKRFQKGVPSGKVSSSRTSVRKSLR